MAKDDVTWLNASYLVFAALAAFFIFKAFELLGVQTNWVETYDWFSSASTGLSIVLAAALTWWLRADAERQEYFVSCVAELRKVTWPSWTDTKRMTWIVVVVVAIFAVIVSVFDLVWAKALKLLIA